MKKWEGLRGYRGRGPALQTPPANLWFERPFEPASDLSPTQSAFCAAALLGGAPVHARATEPISCTFWPDLDNLLWNMLMGRGEESMLSVCLFWRLVLSQHVPVALPPSAANLRGHFAGRTGWSVSKPECLEQDQQKPNPSGFHFQLYLLLLNKHVFLFMGNQGKAIEKNKTNNQNKTFQ